MSNKFEIRKWEVIDIFFYDKDEENIDKVVQSYLEKGWTKESHDDACNKDYDSCIQLMRFNYIKTKDI